MSAPQCPIILLKTKLHPTDPYHDKFSAQAFSCFDPIFVPALQHKPTNLDRLTQLIASHNISSTNAAAEYSGLITTSQRAVEAISVALAKLSDLESFLSTTTVYVVGPATSSAVVALGFAANNVRGAHCGNGAVLATYILANHAPQQAPLLFLNNDKRSDVIPRTLSAGRVALEELVIYVRDRRGRRVPR